MKNTSQTSLTIFKANTDLSHNVHILLTKIVISYPALTQSVSVGDLGSVRVLGEYRPRMLTIRTEGHELRTEIPEGRYFPRVNWVTRRFITLSALVV